ncbi:MAG: hypothetical protein J5744_09265 [Oscillospiraceae bacterium]|nr:hypothetical protein [Oscillospiraceae bacterium]
MSRKKVTYAAGDRVRIIDSEVEATILDRVVSEITGKVAYTLESEDFDGEDWSDVMFTPDELEPLYDLNDMQNIEMKIELADNVVVARVYRGGNQVCVGHGHIFREGLLGFVQAASYAVKRTYERISEKDDD